MKKIKIILTSLATLTLVVSCNRDFEEAVPEKQVSQEQLENEPSALNHVLTGVYKALYSTNAGQSYEDYGRTYHDDFGLLTLKTGADLMSNDMVQVQNHWFGNFYNYNAGSVSNARNSIVWKTVYLRDFVLNKIINTIGNNPSDPQAKRILAEAKALKAYLYFTLTRFYTYTYKGHENDLAIPIYTGKEASDGAKRSTVKETYDFIVKLLNESLVDLTASRSSKININNSVAKGMLAQVYLEMGVYDKAALMAREARASYSLMSEAQWRGNGFSDLNNPEAMWAADITSVNSGIYASFFSHMDNLAPGYTGAVGIYKAIDRRLYEKISNTDYRKLEIANNTGLYKNKTYAPYANMKFKDSSPFTGDYIFMRAAEFYYIEAESLARGGNEAGAQQLLYDITVKRDPSYIKSTNTGQALIDEIMTQKRIEMWGEGCAWFDMKRLGIALERNYTGSNHASFGRQNRGVSDVRMRFQIPQRELDTNPSITTTDQNQW